MNNYPERATVRAWRTAMRPEGAECLLAPGAYLIGS